jgi:hypothetical protein
MRRRLVLAVALAGCGSSHHGLPDGPVGPGGDAPVTAIDAVAITDGTAAIDSIAMSDASSSPDASTTPDASIAPDATVTHDAAPTGIITGGPCLSGAAGATAYRIRWADSAGTAYPVYEVDGLPDHSRDKAGAYGYQIGFSPTYTDMFLAEGGLQLDDSDFIDLEITTVGISQISNATLSIYGRSFSVDASGSFNGQTFVDVGATPDNFVSNVAPYAWWSADMTSAITPGDSGVLIRVKAGPGSDSLVVNRIELCLTAT